MNRDQVAGKGKEIAGTVHQKAGELMGSTSQQLKGLAKRIKGKFQKGRRRRSGGQRGGQRSGQEEPAEESMSSLIAFF